MRLEDPLSIAAVIALVTVCGLGLEHRFRWARKVGASLLIIALGALLSNLDLVPAASPTYDLVTGPVTSLAIIWLLFAVDLRDVARAGSRMLLAFGVAVAATAVGSCVGTLFFSGFFGAETWKLAGVLMGTYSGGSLNFVAVGREVGLQDNLFAATAAADNVLTALWMGACIILPGLLKRYYVLAGPSVHGSGEGEPGREGGVALRTFDLAMLFMLGLVLLRIAEGIESLFPAVPGVIWLTTLALAVGQLPPVRRLSGAMQLGVLALNLFFAVIGIFSRVGEILKVGPEVFFMTAVVISLHGLLTFGVARLLSFDVETTAVASQAAVGGPSTAMALAVSKKWKGLVLPGAMAGLLGYALGNYAGLGVAWVVRFWTGP